MRRFLTALLAVATWVTLLAQEPVKVSFSDGSRFEGIKMAVGADSIYMGNNFLSDMSVASGTFSKDFEPLFVTWLLPDGSKIFRDSLYTSTKDAFYERYIPGEEFRQGMGDIVLRSHSFNGKWYVNSWKFDDERNLYTRDYVAESDFYPSGLNVFNILKWIVYPLMLIGFLVYVMYVLAQAGWVDVKPSLFFLIVVGMAYLLIALVPDKYICFNLLLPMLVFMLLAGIGLIVDFPWKKIFTYCAILIPAAMIVYQYCYTNEKYTLQNGTKVEFRWRAGTDIPQRLVIKNLLGNMIPADSADFLLDKYELREYEYNVVNGFGVSWVGFLFPNRAAYDLSYRQAQLFIRNLQEISGLEGWCIPTDRQWMAAWDADHQARAISEDDRVSVKSGSPNAKGFFHMEDNMTELVATYYPIPCFTIDSRPYRRYDYVATCGNSFRDTKTGTTDQRILKTLGFYESGFRPGFNLAASRGHAFEVRAMLYDKEANEGTFPDSIRIISVDDIELAGQPWEEIEELLIGYSNSERDYRYIRLGDAGNDTLTAKMPAKTDPYVYYPFGM